MVLYKRKPVIYQDPPPLPEDMSVKVWHIPETQEWFYSYQEYLDRLDYYNRRKFVCEVTGNSCFTYFEALESEKHEMKKVDQNFPEPLKEPVLRFLQFSTIPRLDLLVDMVYSQFKNDFYPGESVLVKFQDTKKPAKIKEKARFNAFVDELGMLRPGYCSYRVLFDNSTEVTIDESSISRDRAHFTKWFVKTFIKLSVSRSSKIGAPWIVREQFATKYRIPMEYPPHLLAFAPKTHVPKPSPKSRKRPGNEDSEHPAKRLDSKKDTKVEESQEQIKLPPILPNKVKMVAPKPLFAPAGTPGATTIAIGATGFKKLPLGDIMNANNKQSLQDPSEFKIELREPVYFGPKPPQASIDKMDGLEKMAYVQGLGSYLDVVAPKKCLIEDMDIPMGWPESQAPNELFNDFKIPRPQTIPELKDFISEALQSWIFLNVYSNALILDNFTFDDFINCFKLTEVRNIPLLDEIFCAVLSCFILGENEDVGLRIYGYEYAIKDDGDATPAGNSNHGNGNTANKNVQDDEPMVEIDFPIPTNGKYEDEEFLLVTIPQRSIFDEQSDDEENDGNDDDVDDNDDEEMKENDTTEIKTEDLKLEDDEPNDIQDEGEPKKVNVKVKSESNYGLDFDIYEGIKLSEDPSHSDSESEDEYDNKRNNAGKLLNYRNISWQERLFKRQFKDGYWQIIMLGVLSLVSHLKKYKSLVKQINDVLAPKGVSASASSVQNQFYTKMPIDLKIKALNVLCELLIEGKIIRSYIDNAMEEATRLRRDRLDAVREYKAVMDKARDLNAECNMLLQVWKKDKSATNLVLPPDEDSKRRRRNFTLKFEASEDEISLGNINAGYQKKLDARKECISEANKLRQIRKKIEKKLTELDCARVKIIGKDKFYNRYWWFESNGLPIVNRSSSIVNEDDEDDEDKDNNAAATNNKDIVNNPNDASQERYLMGRLWVQGPSFEDNMFMLDVIQKDFENFYKIKHNLEEKVDKIADQRENFAMIKAKIENSDYTKTEKLPVSFVAAAKEVFDLEFSEDGSIVKDKDGVVIYNKPEVKESKTIDGDSKTENQLVKAEEADDRNANIKQELTENGSEIVKEGGKSDDAGEKKKQDNTKDHKEEQPVKLTTQQRKLICEAPCPMISSKDWRFYESQEEIEQLIRGLVPWGNREAELRKELARIKGAIDASIEARRKALLLDDIPEAEKLLQKEIDEVYFSESDDSDGEKIMDELDEKSKTVTEEEPVEIEEVKPVYKRRTRRAAAKEEKDIEEAVGKSSKEIKGEEEQPNTVVVDSEVEQTIVKRASKRELKRRRLQDHQAKKKEYFDKMDELSELQQEREQQRCSEWVNQCAISRLGHSHYEGPPKVKNGGVSGYKKRKK
ncbi:Itc1 protein [Saccharomycopsis crataegensis]|uniref:Itc1 protein n=1 Tax=Saccharomycopsis crataegensis TaxID=43959 RepID=A0AAV5QLU1_9ASCO|nr:Itc1 protein [Saccharomycopsis crataegensis]